jgi:DNA-binding LacI/PurR family transcriptional regulator
VGVAAAELLLADLDPGDGADEAPREIVLPTEFVNRPSCAPPGR